VDGPGAAVAGVLDTARLATYLAHLPGVRPVVGIDGPGGSGKSTLAARLADRLDGCTVVHADDFYLPSAVRPERDFAIGGQFDLDRLRDQVLVPAGAGRASRYQVYDWEHDRLIDGEDVPADGPVIVEGVYCTEAALREHYDVRVVCGADRALRLRRALTRDGEEMRRLWEEVWMPAEDDYLRIQEPRAHADLVLDGGGPDPDQPRRPARTPGHAAIRAVTAPVTRIRSTGLSST
jgi:uridine kinase